MVTAAESEPSLFDLLETWLERTPYTDLDDFSFFSKYRECVQGMLDGDRDAIAANEMIDEAAKSEQLAELEKTRAHFQSLLEESAHNALVARGDRRLSYKATQAALFITLYQDEPMFTLPYRVLELLQDIDEQLVAWRYRHALMVHRMLGSKIGTGGSSGYNYLRATASRHKVFTDLFNLNTFLIPKTRLPALPDSIRSELAFHGESSTARASPSP